MVLEISQGVDVYWKVFSTHWRDDVYPQAILALDARAVPAIRSSLHAGGAKRRGVEDASVVRKRLGWSPSILARGVLRKPHAIPLLKRHRRRRFVQKPEHVAGGGLDFERSGICFGGGEPRNPHWQQRNGARERLQQTTREQHCYAEGRMASDASVMASSNASLLYT